MIKMVKEGEKAPEFNLKDTNGKNVKLSDFKGKKLLLYFYPKDNTEGCTKEACNLRDNNNLLKKNNIEIVGVSLDNEESHKKFSEKYNLPFTLLCDTSKKTSIDYGVYGKKMSFGIPKMGIIRTSFLIDEKGIIKKIFNKVDTENHASQVLGK